MKTRKNSRFCNFETLESRQLMAGDVTATIMSGDRLVITEAAGHIGTDNGVSISLVNGKIRVAGDYPAEGGSGISKVNGSSKAKIETRIKKCNGERKGVECIATRYEDYGMGGKTIMID